MNRFGVLNCFTDSPVANCKGGEGNDLPRMAIRREYSSEWKPGDELYYPVDEERNSTLYTKDKAMAAQEQHIVFDGRLVEYKYFYKVQVIGEALKKYEQVI